MFDTYTLQSSKKNAQFVDARYGQIYIASERMPRFEYAAIYERGAWREKFKQVRAVRIAQ